MLAARIMSSALAGVLVTLGAFVPASAQTPFVHELKLGILAHDVPDLWSGFRRERGINVNIEAILAPSVAVLGGHLRPAIGASIHLDGGRARDGTSRVYLDARWMIESQNGLFFGGGLGAVVHDGTLAFTDEHRKALGSRVLFHIPVEIGVRFADRHSVSIYFEHMSNANTRAQNEALDALGVRYGYRF
jgi:hypothetical protein